MGSDLAKLYPHKLAQAKNLYPLAYDFFKGPGSLPPGETLTPEMVKSPERQQAFYQLRRLVGLAIDAKYDLSALSEFGLVKTDQGYIIDFAQSPQWASMSSLFFQLRTPQDLQFAAHYLYEVGLSNADMDKIEKYLQHNNPKIMVTQDLQKLLPTNTKSVQQVLQTLKTNTSQAHYQPLLDMFEARKRQRYITWDQWGVNLLNMLSKPKQRILISYLQQRMGGMIIGWAPIDKSYLRKMAEDMISGKAKAQLTTRLDKQRKQFNKETAL
jgi:hypothetical protein